MIKTPTKVLLIEDGKCDQVFFTKVLGEIENAVLLDVANNAKEALQLLDNTAVLPDIIFTDINMPVMDGIEYLKQMAQRPAIKNIPVIVLSSDTAKTELVKQLGAKAFIKKPDDLKILRKEVEAAISLSF